MGIVNYPNGLASAGIPLFGTIPTISGDYYFVDPFAGSDGVGQKSNTMKRPLKTLAKAYEFCTSGRGDGIVLISRGDPTTPVTATRRYF